MELKGPFDHDAVGQYLAQARIPIRLSCNRLSGFPLVASHWVMWHEDSLWCAVQQSSAIARALRRDNRCGFEISGDSPPYFGVRGSATASLHSDRGPEVLAQLIDRYLSSRESSLANWLLRRAATEVAIELRPRTLFSWDYRDRMADSGS